MSISQKSSAAGKGVRHGLQILAIVAVLASFGFWFKTGAHTGFSKNRVEIQKVDPITQIEYVDYEDRFVMGVEYLAAGCVFGIGLFSLSFFFARKN